LRPSKFGGFLHQAHGTTDCDSIIAVTGLSGHAYGSWSHSDERMWLRDYLPKDAPNARILTYGYQSSLQSDSISILEDHTNKFVHKLVDMRDASEVSKRGRTVWIGSCTDVNYSAKAGVCWLGWIEMSRMVQC
jgi:hypothetical protein